MTFTAPNQSDDVVANTIAAGEYLGIALDLGRVSQEQILALKAKIETTSAILTNDEITENLLYANGIVYHAEIDAMDYVRAKTMGIQAMRLPSETIFSYKIKTNYVFGIPLSVENGGFVMDADRLSSVVIASDGNKEKSKQFMLYSGMNSSALEHLVPEKIFSKPAAPVQGISAVKALKIANDSGIPIYTINQSNIDAILPQLQLTDENKTDIINAVSSGKIVNVPKTDISINGWVGTGYIVLDPNTGAGAYMISGGLNGGWVYIVFGGGTSCNQNWAQCYTHCINTLVPINPWTVFTNVTLYGNILYYLGGGVTTITIAEKAEKGDRFIY